MVWDPPDDTPVSCTGNLREGFNITYLDGHNEPWPPWSSIAGDHPAEVEAVYRDLYRTLRQLRDGLRLAHQ